MSLCSCMYDRMWVGLASQIPPLSDDYGGPHTSSQASKLPIKDGTGLLNDMCNKQPGVVNQWAAVATGEIFVDEVSNLLAIFGHSKDVLSHRIMSEFPLE